MRIIIFLTVFLCGIFPVYQVGAQTVQSPVPTWNQTTLMGWFMDSQIFMLNRSQSQNGLVPERGLFNRTTSLMDDESVLDLLNFQFNLNEDYLWFRSPNGFRTWIGQTNTAYASHVTEMKSTVKFAEKHKLFFHVQSHETFRAQRHFGVFEYQYQLIPSLSMGLNHTITEFKADMDIGMFVQLGDLQKGLARIDFKVLDYLNNGVFQDMDIPMVLVEQMRQYQQQPYYVSFMGASPQIGRFRAEAYFATSTESASDVGQANNPISTRFQHIDWSNVFGALVEAQFTFFTASLFTNREFSFGRFGQSPGAVVRPDFETTQIRQQFGMFLMGTARDFRWDSKIVYELYSDEQRGSSFIDANTINQAFNYSDNRFLMNTRFRYQPQLRGPIIGVNHLLDFRNFNDEVDTMIDFSPSFHDYNGRFGTFFGWQFNPRITAIGGYQFDLDRDFHRIQGGEFRDAGYIRMEIRW